MLLVKLKLQNKQLDYLKGQFGNSEVGHLNLGAGSVVRQDITKIDYEIETGDFYKNKALNSALTQSTSGTVHIMGLLSMEVSTHTKIIFMN